MDHIEGRGLNVFENGFVFDAATVVIFSETTSERRGMHEVFAEVP